MQAELLLIAGAALYGLAVGSFLNVVIIRVPLKQSISHPGSACPQCAAAIGRRDNIPVLSWMILRGRCRACHAPISARYPLVEVLTAALFVEVALRFGWSWTLPGELALVAGLVALAFCDLDHFVLPKRIVYPTAILVSAGLVLASAVQGTWGRLGVAVACAAVEFAVLFTITVVSPRSMGFGDVRLGPVIALGLGWIGVRYAVVGFLVANLLGAIVGVVLIATRRATRKTPVPYGVFLAAGAVLTIAVGSGIHYPGLSS